MPVDHATGAAGPSPVAAIVAGTFGGWWLYLVGPVVGGIVAAVAYDRFVRKADAP